jgi:leader peptidase (prepilin peptidase) / N-methyltransferase
MSEVPAAFWAVFAGLLGLAIGSFLNVVVHRVPLGLSVVHPPSACPGCGHQIRARHNVPVLGWLVLRGRCYDCRMPISVRYPVVEAAAGTVFALVTLGVLAFDLPLLLLASVASGGVVLVVGLTGADQRGSHRL